MTAEVRDACSEAIGAAIRLTDEQLERLTACARGISLRFDNPHLVKALVDGGYAERNIAGVVSVTASGRAYLRSRGF